jgi:hypothetical protein
LKIKLSNQLEINLNHESNCAKTQKMENHVGIMVICLSTDKPDVCPRFPPRKRTAPISKDTCVYIDSRSNHGDIFTKDPQAFLELDL